MAATKTPAVIPRLSWDKVRPAPVVLVSGTEDFLAERAIRLLRDILKRGGSEPRGQRPAMPTGYAPGSCSRSPARPCSASHGCIRVDGRREVHRRLPRRDARVPRGARPTTPTGAAARRRRARQEAARRDPRGGRAAASRSSAPSSRSDSDKYDFAAAEFPPPASAIAPGALRALVVGVRRRPGRTGRRVPAAASPTSATRSPSRPWSKYYGGRVETNAFQVADAAIAGRHGEALIRCATRSPPAPTRCRMVAAFASKLRTMAQGVGQRGGSGASWRQQFGLAPWQVDRARRDLQGWTDAGLGAAIEAAGRDRCRGQGRRARSGVRARAHDRHRQPRRG